MNELKVSLRKYPYPFEGALAICNDIDCTTFEDFIEMHRFLNTSQDTPWGKGLSLEIGDSFWMFSVQPENDPGFSHFDGIKTELMPNTAQMRAFLRAGYLDALHTYGNFTQRGGFHRNLALSIADEFEKEGFRVPVWINHGDLHNFQNISSDTYTSGLGDKLFRENSDGTRTPNLEYHTDLFSRLGIRYVWIGDLTVIFAQNRRALRAEHFLATMKYKGRKCWKDELKDLILTMLHGKLERIFFVDNSLCRPYILNDGQTVRRFVRVGIHGRDYIDDLEWLLSDAILSSIVRRGGASIIFIHMGKRRELMGPLFPDIALEGLIRLKRWNTDGKIFVTTTSRLLNYLNLNVFIDYKTQVAEKRISIYLNPNHYLENFLMAQSEIDFSGLTFYVPLGYDCSIYHNSQQIPVIANPPDYTGRISISIPWRSLNPDDCY